MAAAVDDEWETDEETDVVVKLSGVIRDEFIKTLSTASKPKCSALGLLSEEPLIQIGSNLFKGSYGHPSGTHLLLKEPQSAEGSTGELQYLTTTDKELDMNKLFVQEKHKQETPTDKDLETAEEGTVQETSDGKSEEAMEQ